MFNFRIVILVAVLIVELRVQTENIGGILNIIGYLFPIISLLCYLFLFRLDFSLEFINDFIDILRLWLGSHIKTEGILYQFHLTRHIIQSFSLRLEEILLGALVVQRVLNRWRLIWVFRERELCWTDRTPGPPVEMGVVREDAGHLI